MPNRRPRATKSTHRSCSQRRCCAERSLAAIVDWCHWRDSTGRPGAPAVDPSTPAADVLSRQAADQTMAAVWLPPDHLVTGKARHRRHRYQQRPLNPGSRSTGFRACATTHNDCLMQDIHGEYCCSQVTACRVVVIQVAPGETSTAAMASHCSAPNTTRRNNIRRYGGVGLLSAP